MCIAAGSATTRPVFWMRASASANTTADFVLLATHLGLPVRDASKPDDVVSDIEWWLARPPARPAGCSCSTTPTTPMP
jgi:hypothetical protein